MRPFDHDGLEWVRRFAAPAAGPALILAGVLVVLRNLAFHPLLTMGDVRTLWLPTYCFLGKNLVHGHIPAWNPHSMAGVPFAADPQSGWMYLPAMLLFALFSCGFAIRLMIVLQPILAGLGVYWFLRGEGVSRPASTVGGLTLALGLAGSKIPLAIPFSASLAWTALALAACSRYLRATDSSRRFLWLVATGVAWGQIAAAHLSVGLLMGTVALSLFVAGKTWKSELRQAGRAVALLAVSLPLVNLAYFLPRLAYAPRTSLGLGYAGLKKLAATFGDRGIIPPPITTGPVWPLKLVTSPGAFLGSVALGLSFAALWNRRHRRLAIMFAVLGSVSYILGLEAVAHVVPTWLRSNRVADFYLHNPYWTIFQLFLAIAVLGALGIEAWRDAKSWKTRALMVLPAVVVWAVLPVLFGARPTHFVLPAAGAAAGFALLVGAARWNVLFLALPAVVALELTVNGVAARRTVLPFHPPPSLGALPVPNLRLQNYLRLGHIHRRLRQSTARYATVGFDKVFDRVTNESLYFGTESIDAYNAVQLRRYWSFVRALQDPPIEYNRAYFVHPSRAVLDVLGVNWTVRRRRPARPGRRRPQSVVNEHDWTLVRRSPGVSRVAVINSWTVVGDANEALQRVSRPSFDPSRTLILEGDAGIAASEATRQLAQATYRWTGTQSARVQVRTGTDALLIVRNAYDEHWHATVDGRPAPVLPADYVIQAVPVPRGTHTVDLTYDDPWVGYGLLGSAVVISGLLGFAARERFLARRRGRAEAEPSAS